MFRWSPGKLIVVGGQDGVQSLNTTELYDPAEDVWTPGPKMLTRRANVNVAVADGKLFAVGGFSGKSRAYLSETPSVSLTAPWWG